MTIATGAQPAIGSSLDWRCINAIRFLCIDAVEKAKSGHLGAPIGCAPAAYTLWDRHLCHNPLNPLWPDRDRFVLSNGHASMLQYALLHLTGYGIGMEDIRQFRQWESITPGHPEREITPGVEVTTGPLGQGIANAVGLAIAEQILADAYNRPGHNIIGHYTYVFCSDGDLMEGVASEAVSLAGTLGLGRLIAFYDDNNISIDGHTDMAFREDMPARFRAAGWHVQGPVDGNDVGAIDSAIRSAQDAEEHPSLIVLKTVIGYGTPKAGTAAAHHGPLGADGVAETRRTYDWQHPPFEVPGDVLDHMREAVDRGEQAERRWNERFASYRSAYPALAEEFGSDQRGDLQAGWDAGLDGLLGSFKEKTATRIASGKALEALTRRVPRLVGGSADLASSNMTYMPGRGDFSPENRAGRNIRYGVREHVMVSASTGIAAHGGLIPFASTFLIFSDYARAAIRLAAVSQVHAIYVFTHDSVGLGEDGPTHQPISQLMGLRLIPNLVVLRPADADETVEAWRVALAHRGGPVALALSRQGVPSLDSVGATVEARGNFQRGAYTVRDATGDDPEVILIGTGSEVQHALRAAVVLEGESHRVRVVSMPSWDLFEAQPAEYRDSVLPPRIRARVSIEAGITRGWQQFIGLDGMAVGTDRFGASAPGEVVLERLGMTADAVVSAARQVMDRLA